MPPPYLMLGSTFGADYLAVGAAIGLELRTTGEHEYLHTQLFTGFMYIAASLCTFLLRGWKISANDTDVVEAGELDSESSAPGFADRSYAKSVITSRQLGVARPTLDTSL